MQHMQDASWKERERLALWRILVAITRRAGGEIVVPQIDIAAVDDYDYLTYALDADRRGVQIRSTRPPSRQPPQPTADVLPYWML